MNINKTRLNFNLIFIVIITIFSFGIFLSSCNENPTSLGFPLDTLEVMTISSEDEAIITDSENQYARLQTMYNRPFFYVGKYNDMTAVSFLRYRFVPDTLTYVDESKIVSVKLNLKPTRYAIGDTVAGNFAFDVYELQKPFTNQTNWEEIYPTGNGGNEVSDFFKAGKVGSYSGKITLKDTLDAFKADLDKKLIVDWLRFAESTDTTQYSYSFALIPNSGSTFISKLFAPGNSTSTVAFDPTIEVIYKNKTDELDTLIIKTAVYSSFVNANKPTDANKIVVQGGVAMRSLLHFDISKIPAKSSIVKAQLELHIIDEESYAGNRGKDTTLTASMDSIGVVAYNVPFAAIRESGSTKFVFPSISSAVQKWNLADGKGSLTIYANRNGNDFEEPAFLDRYTFHGTKSADVNKRPKLTIFYTKRPNL